MLLLASVLRSYTITSTCRFTWVHACVKERVLEHLNGVFIGCGEKGYCVAEGGTGWEHWLYILIPTVYTTLYFHLYFTTFLST
jgi:hypothetical protein